jgi:hypothetical protein
MVGKDAHLILLQGHFYYLHHRLPLYPSGYSINKDLEINAKPNKDPHKYFRSTVQNYELNPIS